MYSHFLFFFSASRYALWVRFVDDDDEVVTNLFVRPENASTTMADGVIDEEELREIVGSK